MDFLDTLDGWDRKHLASKGLVFLFVFGKLDLVSCDMRKLQALYDALFFEYMDDNGMGPRPHEDPHSHRSMALMFIIDYFENITEEMKKGKDYDTVVEEYTGRTTYIHEEMKDGDFRTKEEIEEERESLRAMIMADPDSANNNRARVVKLQTKRDRAVKIKQEEDQL